MLGTTTRPYFLDRTAQPGMRYDYRVVAETGSGATSGPSNLQQVPDPRPPATFAQLERLERAVHEPAVAPAMANARGGRISLLARLTWLARTAGNDQVRELAYRLERRLRYENVAAGSARRG
jgi:hypothetical protein